MRHRIGALTLLAVVGLLNASTLTADVRMPHVFGTHMVLQRDKPLPVWGWADPGEKVTVRLGSHVAKAQAGQDGRWRVDLPLIHAGEGLTMTVDGRNRLTFEDIAIGEVWICSGQSNMAWPVGACINAQAEIAAAKLPGIRLLQVPRVLAGFPNADVDVTWAQCSPETVKGFSAVGYFFGRKLHKDLDVPVGLIDSSWGGSLIEPWTPPVGFQAVPALAGISRRIETANPATDAYKTRLQAYLGQLTDWMQTARTALAKETPLAAAPAYPGELLPLTARVAPTSMYNTMIHPLVPYTIRGAIWYQGESNLRDAMLYAKKTEALVTGWSGMVWSK